MRQDTEYLKHVTEESFVAECSVDCGVAHTNEDMSPDLG